MRVTLLGTGCPSVHPRRYGPSQLVEAAGARLLVDCGNGCTQRLVEAGATSAAIDALLVTHLHSDHLVDLWQLVVSGWHQGRARPLDLYGPAPVLEHARRLVEAWSEERAQRLSFEKRGRAEGLDIGLHEIAAGQRLDFGGAEVEVVEVDHRPVAPAFGFVVRDGHHTLALSGDTRSCPALIEAAHRCDLLVHEVFVHGSMPARSGVRSAETLAAVASYHTLDSEVGKVACEAGAKALLLTHLVPPDADPERILAEVRKSYSGPVIVGEDLMTVDVATRQATWRGMTMALPA
jgi:ribonuclease Z